MSARRRAALACCFVSAAVVVTGCTEGGRPSYTMRWDEAVAQLDLLAQGLQVTVLLTVANVTLGMLLGVVIAAARLAALAPIRAIATLFVELFRGTPLLIQLIWAYYALPIVTGISLPSVVAVSVALTCNMAAFSSEAFRAGIQAVPREHIESANVLGLSAVQRMRYVVLPQATLIVLPVLMSLAIGLFKDSSLVAFVGINDLMYQGTSAALRTYRPLEILTTVALIYFLVAFPSTLLLRRLEVYLNRHRA